ncbi:MAG: GAF domain-containing protein, partial [Betaproteobacteria bacterium]
MQEVEERYALATSAALEGIYEWDLEAGRLFLTERAKEFFALAGDELTPAAWNARVHPADYPAYVAAIIDHFKKRTPHLEHEYRIVDAEGGYRWILDRGVGVRDASGRITKVVGALSDITRRKSAEIELRRARDRAEAALEQQTAMSEILRVMSRSPTDAQPVFDLVAQRAGKLCNAEVAVVSRVDGKLIELAAIDGVAPEAVRIVRSLYPMQIDAETVTARVIRGSSVVHIADVLADPSYAIKDFALAARFRAGLGVPIVRDRQVIGSIFVGRSTPGFFAESQVDLLKTFADQAAIAIENVRLFKELEVRNGDLTQALEQQTATSEILRVVSRSPTNVQPVFDTIAAAALKLCRASSALVFTFDGELIHLAAAANLNAEGADAWHQSFPRPPGRDTAATRAVLTCSVVAIPDVLEDPHYLIGPTAATTGFRSALAVPLIRERKPIGVIGVGRPEPGCFPANQVALLETFADQAVIAIENVRLFTELEARTHQLTRSVGELKALGEVGQAVSSTLELETVLFTIVSRATQLAGMDGGSIWEYDGAREEFYLRATCRLPGDLVEVVQS